MLGCADGLDCDAETALPPPDSPVQLPLGWSTAFDCALDDADRVITNTVVEYVQSNTPFACATHCNSLNYPYAGVEYGDECYCGTGLRSGIQNATAGACNMLCPGSYYDLCGGSWAMQIYQRN